MLEAFSATSRPLLGVTEISEIVGLHKSTVSRMLAGLTEAGYVQRDLDSGRYRLGLGMIGLAGPLLAELDVRRAAFPHLEEITQTTGETAALAVWNGSTAIVVEQVASPHLVKHSANIGTRFGKFASSSVRVFLAELPADEVDRLLSTGAVDRLLSTGAVDRLLSTGAVERLLSTGAVEREGYAGPEDPAHRHLDAVRDAGVAVNDGETTFEEYGVSAPVRDYRGKVIGCITVSAPRSRVQYRGNQAELREAVLQAVSVVSARLGGASEPGQATAS